MRISCYFLLVMLFLVYAPVNVSAEIVEIENCTSFCAFVVTALEEARKRVAQLETKNAALKRICYDAGIDLAMAEASASKQSLNLPSQRLSHENASAVQTTSSNLSVHSPGHGVSSVYDALSQGQMRRRLHVTDIIQEVTSFAGLVRIVKKNNTRAVIKKNITLNSTIHISEVSWLVLTNGANGTIALDGGGAVRLFNITNSHVIFRDLLFTNGYTKHGGGALLLLHSNVVIRTSKFALNYAGDAGGAVYSHNSTVDMNNLTFRSNSANKAGAVYIHHSTVDMKTCTFQSNSAPDDAGAAYIISSTVDMKGCLYISNNGNDGGAVLIEDSTVDMIGCSFVANTADDDAGGVLSYSGVVTMEDCSFILNVASDKAGAYYNEANGVVDMSGCSFVSNSAYQGGGIFCTVSSATIAGCYFNSNLATDGTAVFTTTSTVNISNTYLNFTEGDQVEDGTAYVVSYTSACRAGEYGVCIADEDGRWSCKLDVCRECPKGKYSKAGAKSESGCLACDGGKFNNQSAASSCDICGPGYYTSDASGQSGISSEATACLECPAGKYQEDGLSYCDSCEAGKSSSAGSINCTACSAGKYTRLSGESTCTTCDKGRRANKLIGASSCDKCTFPLTSWKGSTQCSICEDEYYMQDNNTCAECPPNGNCLWGASRSTGIANVEVNRGFWRVGPSYISILPCTPNPDACVGGNYSSEWGYCQENANGPYCQVCEKGYFRENKSCEKCGSYGELMSQLYIALGLIFFLVIMVIASRHFRIHGHRCMDTLTLLKTDVLIDWYHRVKPKFKINVVFSQIASDFPGQFPFQYPEVFTRVSNELSSIFSLGFIAFVPEECVWDSRKDRYYRTLFGVTSTPLILVAMGIVIYTTRRSWIRKSTADKKEAKKKVEGLYAFAMEAFLAFSYIVFVPCSQATLAYFVCTEKEEGLHSFLEIDATTECWPSHQYKLWLSYALAMVFVYPLGIPLLYFCLLWRHRDGLDPVVPSTGRRSRMTEDVTNVYKAIDIRSKNSAVKPMTFLFDAYEPCFWWWECLVCVDRLLMTNLNVILRNEAQLRVFLALVLALLNVKLYSQLDPYIDDTDDIFAEVGKWSTVAIIIFSITLQCGAVQSATSGTGYILIILLASVLVYFCLFCVYIIFTETYEEVEKQLQIQMEEENCEKESELVPVAIDDDSKDEGDTCFSTDSFIFQIDENQE